MGLIDILGLPGQAVAYMFPESSRGGIKGNGGTSTKGVAVGGATQDEVFVFQYWPTQIQDRYEVEYAQKQIFGASHPLYQWVGGRGRTISFDAIFTAEVSENDHFPQVAPTYNSALQAGSLALGAAAAFLPSTRYTVDVAAAVGTLQSYLYPAYDTPSAGLVQAPPRMVLVLPGTRLGRRKGSDGILVILLRADVTIEAWFPHGEPRVATVSLEFAEVVQHTSTTDGTSNIQYISSTEYYDAASTYLLNNVSVKNFGSS